jgi:hypothetical protein
VSDLERRGAAWHLQAQRGSGVEDLGRFSHVVVAHNGKCADRLMKGAKTPAVHRALVCQFGAEPTGAAKMQLSSLWVLVFRTNTPLPVPYEGSPPPSLTPPPPASAVEGPAN